MCLYSIESTKIKPSRVRVSDRHLVHCPISAKVRVFLTIEMKTIWVSRLLCSSCALGLKCYTFFGLDRGNPLENIQPTTESSNEPQNVFHQFS